MASMKAAAVKTTKSVNKDKVVVLNQLNRRTRREMRTEYYLYQ